MRPKGGLSAERGLAVKYRKSEVVAAATERVFRPKDAAEIVSVRLTVVLYPDLMAMNDQMMANVPSTNRI